MPWASDKCRAGRGRGRWGTAAGGGRGAGALNGAQGAKRMTRLGSAPLERSRPQRNETN